MKHDFKKVILLELNEISWRILDPLIQAGKLPMFAEFIQEGTRGVPMALEEPPDLDPWISWMTLYTGRPQSEHGVRFLEQPAESVTGPKIWEIAADHGRSVGVYGSIMSWPPRKDVHGFWVPSTFSKGTETFPEELSPIQELNLTATRAHSPLGGDRRTNIVRLGRQLKRLGLSVSSVLKVIKYLVRSKLTKARDWEKVSLQPIVNLDFYKRLYQQYRPDFSTFHSNHVAHYQHRYWRAMDASEFKTAPSEQEVARYGQSIEYGYRVADRLLHAMWQLADDRTVFIVASGLGQKPQSSGNFGGGKPIVRIKSIADFLELCQMRGKCEPLSMMAPQWILNFDDLSDLRRMSSILESAWYISREKKLFSHTTVGDSINFNFFQNNMVPPDLSAVCGFPELNGYECQLGDLALLGDPTPKTGMHEQAGVLLMRGSGVKKAHALGSCDNLDFAPTMLRLLGIPIPEYMRGEVLEDAFDELPAAQDVRQQIVESGSPVGR